MPTPTSPEIPLSYVVPPFPSLYWPFNNAGPRANYLFFQSDIWRFTLYWTLILYAAVHLSTSLWAVLMQIRQVSRVEYATRNKRKHRASRHARTGPNSSGSVTGSGGGSGSRDDHEIELNDRGKASSNNAATSIRPGPTESTRKKARRLRWVWLIPVVYCVIGGIEALMAGSVVGVVYVPALRVSYHPPILPSPFSFSEPQLSLAFLPGLIRPLPCFYMIINT